MPSIHPISRTILVVDDEPALRSFAQAVLEDLGYAAALAESGRAAVQLVLQDPAAVDVVLLDMTMPGMRPEETFRLLKEIRPDLPVVILSGDLESEVRKRFPEGAISGYVPKPYTDEELAPVLAVAMAEPPLRPPAPFQLAHLPKDEIAAIKAQYVAKCRLEMPAVLQALATRDFISLQVTGHSLKGSAGCFGLLALTQIGRALEGFAVAGDMAACNSEVQKLTQHLKSEQEGVR